jgi:uncharacterized integral membrane protein
MKRLRLYLLAVVALLLVIFLIQNADTVQLVFLFWTFPTRRAFLVLGMLLLGMVAGWLLTGRRNRRAPASAPAEPPAPTAGTDPESGA